MQIFTLARAERVATVSSGRFIYLYCLIVASQGPFLVVTSTRRLAKGSFAVIIFFRFLVHIITPLIGVLKIALCEDRTLKFYVTEKAKRSHSSKKTRILDYFSTVTALLLLEKCSSM